MTHRTEKQPHGTPGRLTHWQYGMCCQTAEQGTRPCTFELTRDEAVNRTDGGTAKAEQTHGVAGYMKRRQQVIHELL